MSRLRINARPMVADATYIVSWVGTMAKRIVSALGALALILSFATLASAQRGEPTNPPSKTENKPDLKVLSCKITLQPDKKYEVKVEVKNVGNVGVWFAWPQRIWWITKYDASNKWIGGGGAKVTQYSKTVDGKTVHLGPKIAPGQTETFRRFWLSLSNTVKAIVKVGGPSTYSYYCLSDPDKIVYDANPSDNQLNCTLPPP